MSDPTHTSSAARPRRTGDLVDKLAERLGGVGVDVATGRRVRTIEVDGAVDPITVNPPSARGSRSTPTRSAPIACAAATASSHAPDGGRIGSAQAPSASFVRYATRRVPRGAPARR